MLDRLRLRAGPLRILVRPAAASLGGALPEGALPSAVAGTRGEARSAPSSPRGGEALGVAGEGVTHESSTQTVPEAVFLHLHSSVPALRAKSSTSSGKPQRLHLLRIPFLRSPGLGQMGTCKWVLDVGRLG